MKTNDLADPFGVARATSKARAEKAAAEAPKEDPTDRDEAYCFQHLVIAAYMAGIRMGMGVLPDGAALWMRLSVPLASEDPRAGYVAFVVADEPRALLNKALQALESSVQSNFWKKDRYASPPVE